MMVGDDEVEAEALRGFGFGKGAHAGVHRDDQAHALGICRFKHARLQAVALAQPMRHMKANHAAEHFNGGLQQHDGGGAVHVVVAVEQDRFACARWRASTRSTAAAMPSIRQGIVEMGDIRIEKREGFVRRW